VGRKNSPQSTQRAQRSFYFPACSAGSAVKHRLLPTAHWLPYLALGIGVVGLGLAAIFVKWANAPGPVSGFYRVTIAALVLALPFGVEARRRAPLSYRHVALALLAGLFFAGDLAAWNTSILITSAANATLLANTSPLWVGLGALWLFKERLRPAFWGGLLLAMLGAMVILGRKGAKTNSDAQRG